MISVSVDLRKTRAKYHSKPGVVFFRIYGPTSDGSRSCLNVTTNITGEDSSVMDIHKDEILVLIRLIYHFVVSFDKKGQQVTVNNVADFLRAIIKDETRKNKLIPELDLGAPLRADLFTVGYKFHNYLQFIFPQPSKIVGYSEELISFITYRSDVFKSENKISTSRSYTALSKVLKQFVGNNIIKWTEITPVFIINFAQWLIEQGFKDSTQGYYMGMLRTILFQANEEGYCSVNPEWFKNVKTQAISKHQDQKKEKIDIDVIKRINHLDLHDNENLSLARDLFMFAFYCRGMELIDVAFLKMQNIQGDILIYNKRLKGKEIRVPIEKEAETILHKYNNGNEYIFPLLGQGRANLFSTKRTWVNYQLKTIGKLVGYQDLSFISNIEAWTTILSNMRISETFLSTGN